MAIESQVRSKGDVIFQVCKPIEGSLLDCGFGESHRFLKGFSSSSIQFTGLDSMY